MIISESLEAIIKIVCDFYNVSPTHFVSEKRYREFAYTRYAYYYFARELVNEGTEPVSYEKIGHFAGNRCHATVINGIKRVIDRIRFEKLYAIEINLIRERLYDAFVYEKENSELSMETDFGPGYIVETHKGEGYAFHRDKPVHGQMVIRYGDGSNGLVLPASVKIKGFIN